MGYVVVRGQVELSKQSSAIAVNLTLSVFPEKSES